MCGDNHSIREQIGKTFGDEVTITIEPDAEPRLVKIPAGLAKAFKANPGAEAFFKKMSYTHQREYVTWIEEAKKDETRQSRIAKTIDMLKRGKKGR
jgi:uncharacterized protein YdeI (YjbR/CyaY-like superfamily)